MVQAVWGGTGASAATALVRQLFGINVVTLALAKIVMCWLPQVRRRVASRIWAAPMHSGLRIHSRRTHRAGGSAASVLLLFALCDSRLRMYCAHGGRRAGNQGAIWGGFHALRPYLEYRAPRFRALRGDQGAAGAAQRHSETRAAGGTGQVQKRSGNQKEFMISANRSDLIRGQRC